MQADVDISCGETLVRLNKLYRTGPPTVATQFHAFWDVPSKTQIADHASYFEDGGNSAFLKISTENIVLAVGDSPGKRKISFIFC